jgi:hypothetical protein
VTTVHAFSLGSHLQPSFHPAHTYYRLPSTIQWVIPLYGRFHRHLKDALRARAAHLPFMPGIRAATKNGTLSPGGFWITTLLKGFLETCRSFWFIFVVLEGITGNTGQGRNHILLYEYA